MSKTVKIIYRNWRGEVAERTIIPECLWHGATEWHPEPQWLLRAMDVDKGDTRDFALTSIGAPLPAVDPGEDVLPEDDLIDMLANSLIDMDRPAMFAAMILHYPEMVNDAKNTSEGKE